MANFGDVTFCRIFCLSSLSHMCSYSLQRLKMVWTWGAQSYAHQNQPAFAEPRWGRFQLNFALMLGARGGQSDKKVLPCADHALNFVPFSRIAMFGINIPFSRIFHGEISERYPFQGYIFLNHPFQGLTSPSFLAITLVLFVRFSKFNFWVAQQGLLLHFRHPFWPKMPYLIP